jgi:Yip1-like protein
MATTTVPNTFLQRLVGALALDATIYEEVEADRTATGQALAVVVLSSVAAGIGSRGLGGTTFQGIVFIAVVSLIAWAAWALVIFEIGARLLPERGTRVDVGELLRTIGFAAAPGLLRVLGVMTAATIPVFAVTAIWMLAAMIVAVRQALDFQSTMRAVAVCCLGWVLAIAIAVVLGLFFGPSVS